MAGYTRQSIADIINGADITAPPLNREFDEISDAFDAASGHSHDGTLGNAPKIDLTTSVTGYLPAVHGGIGGKNNFAATSNPTVTDDSAAGYAPGSMWENTSTGRIFICVGNTVGSAVWRELVQVETSNKIEPIVHDSIDLGTPTVRFQDIYLSGSVSAATNISAGGTLSVTGLSTLASLNVTGATTLAGATSLNGNITLGNTTLDNITFTGRVVSDVVPNGAYDLGSPTQEWTDLFIDGIAHIDTLDVDENAGIDGNLSVAGTLGVTGTTTFGTATGSNLTASGTINFAGATVSNLGTVTTAAIGGGTINNTTIGGSNAAAITGTTITANTGFSGPLTGNVTGNVSGNITAPTPVSPATSVSTFHDVTVNNSLDMTSGTISNLADPTANDHAANKGYIDTQITNLIGGAPSALDTLNELAAAINDDANVYTNLTASIATKLPLAGGTMTGAISMGNSKITNLATPTAAADAATKQYVDDVETQAQSYANDAANSAAAAAASYDSFDDRYLGSKASDPTLDNDSQTLITGALYFNSTNGVMKVYNGTEWVNTASSIDGIKSNLYYTATAGQTVFSGADDNSNTLTVDQINLVNVFMNGVRLHEDDYTVSSASNSVTLGSGATAGDLIYLEVFGNFAGQSGSAVNITGGSISGLTSLSVDGEVDISASNARLNLYETDTTDTNTQLQSSNSRFMIKTLSDDGATATERLRVSHTNGQISFYASDGTTQDVVWSPADNRLTVTADLKLDGDYPVATGGVALGSNALSSSTTGNNNTAIGSSALSSVTIGANNTALGFQALRDNTGYRNTAVGADAGRSITTGTDNTAVGWTALQNATTASNNTAIGRASLASLTEGNSNTAVGYGTLNAVTTGINNVAVGLQAGNAIVGGSYNVLVGNNVGASITGGIHNTMVGNLAGNSQTTADYSTFIGRRAGYNVTTAPNQTFIGADSGFATTTGTDNTGVGYRSLYLNTTGIQSVALGVQAGEQNTTGNRGVFLGFRAGQNNTTGLRTVAIGGNALTNNTTANNNIGIGDSALYTNTTGFSNIGVGYGALYNSNSNNNVGIGKDALYANTDGTALTAIGTDALTANTTGNGSIAIGHQALLNNTTANYNTIVGYNAGRDNTTGSGLVGVGYVALFNNTTGYNSTAVGRQALRAQTTGYENTAIGWNSMLAATTSSGNTALGSETLEALTTGNNNVAAGSKALESLTTGSSNIAVGRQALRDTVTGIQNVAMGHQALQSQTGSNATAVGHGAALVNTASGISAFGHQALGANTTGIGNVAIGKGALLSNTTGSNNVAVGQNVLDAVTTADNNTGVGHDALTTNTTGEFNSALGTEALRLNTTGGGMAAVGYRSLYSNTTGYSHTAIGREALEANTTGLYNTAVGRQALEANTTSSYNTAIGTFAGQSGTTSGNNTYVGYAAGLDTTSGGNTFVGRSAGSAMTTGSGNTIIGRWGGNTDGLDIRTSSNNIVLADGNFSARLHIDSSGNPTFRATAPILNVTTTTTSGNDAVIRVSGARTSSSTSNIATVRFANQTTSPYNLAEIVARDPAGAHANGRGRLVFRTSSSGTLSDVMDINYDGVISMGSSGNSTQLNLAGAGGTGTISTDGAQFLGGTDKVELRQYCGTTSGRTLQSFRNPNGQVGYILISGSSVSYNTSSDYRLKENVVDLTSATERLKQLQPKRFNFIADADTTVDGFLAHEVSDIVPEAVSGTKDAMIDEEYEVTPEVRDDEGNLVSEAVMGTRSVPDYQGIDQAKLVPLLTAALQEAITKIEQLEARVATLEG